MSLKTFLKEGDIDPVWALNVRSIGAKNEPLDFAGIGAVFPHKVKLAQQVLPGSPCTPFRC